AAPDRGVFPVKSDEGSATMSAAPASPVHHDAGTEPGAGTALFEKFLAATIRFEASDLIIKTGAAPKIRLRGALKPLKADPVTKEDMFQIAKDILDEDQYAAFRKRGSADFAYDYDDRNR